MFLLPFYSALKYGDAMVQREELIFTPSLITNSSHCCFCLIVDADCVCHPGKSIALQQVC